MSNCPRATRICTATVITEASAAECKDWTCCLPWGASLEFKDGCLKYTPGNPPADGEYGSVTVVDGCIVSASPLESDVYRGDPCAPVPCPCGSSDEGESNLCNPSTTSGNLYSCDMTGKPLVKCYINGGDNVSVTGSGTSTSPFVISVDVDSGITAVNTNTGSVIKTSKSDSIAYVDHAECYGETDTINGFIIDKYGHITAYNAPSTTNGVQAVVAGVGVTATTDQSTGIVTVELADPTYKLAGDYEIGGYTLTLDAKNRVEQLERSIEGTAGTSQWGTQQVERNDYGSIESVAETGTTGTWIHAILDPPASSAILQRTIDFTLRYRTALMVEVVASNTQTWADALTIKLDGYTVGDVVRIAGSSRGTCVIRAMASGIWEIGTHTLKISSATGFDTTNAMSVSIIPVQAIDSSSDDEIIG